MKVTVTIPGNVRELELPEKTTVATLICQVGFYDDDDISVRVNEHDAFSDQVLSDGDRVFITRPVVGRVQLPEGSVQEGVRRLKEFTAGAQELIIIDPYIVKPAKGTTTSAYVNLLSNCANIDSGVLKRIHLVDSWWHHKDRVLAVLSSECAQHQCTLTHKQTDKIHDRVWIKDGKQAIAVGTSLNSVGGRLSFALILPEEDLAFLIEFLHQKSLMQMTP